MTTQKSFAQLFKKYRLLSEFETLREFADALAEEGKVYDESLFSHWKKGTRIPKDRHLILDVLRLFVKRKGIITVNDANEFLQACGQGNLDKNEVAKLSEISFIDQTDYSYISQYILNF